MTDSLNVSTTQDRDVERRPEPIAVEPMGGRRRRSARPHVATDDERQGVEFGECPGRSARQPVGVDADLEEGTARDSAPKLCVGHANAVRLPP